MTRWFTDVRSLENHILNVAVANGQSNFTEFLAGRLGAIMAEKFYGTYEPSVYQRSYDLITSITTVSAKVENGAVVTYVYLDPEKLKETTFIDARGNRYIRHAWHDKQGIIDATSGISGNGMQRFYKPVDNPSLPYVMPSKSPVTEGSYWLDSVEFVRSDGLPILKDELKIQGVNVV